MATAAGLLAKASAVEPERNIRYHMSYHSIIIQGFMISHTILQHAIDSLSYEMHCDIIFNIV
jgi:hypothetical protein